MIAIRDEMIRTCRIDGTLDITSLSPREINH